MRNQIKAVLVICLAVCSVSLSGQNYGDSRDYYTKRVFTITLGKDFKKVQQLAFKVKGFRGVFTSLHGALMVARDFEDLRNVEIKDVYKEDHGAVLLDNSVLIPEKPRLVLTDIIWGKDLAYFECTNCKSKYEEMRVGNDMNGEMAFFSKEGYISNDSIKPPFKGKIHFIGYGNRSRRIEPFQWDPEVPKTFTDIELDSMTKSAIYRTEMLSYKRDLFLTRNEAYKRGNSGGPVLSNTGWHLLAVACLSVDSPSPGYLIATMPQINSTTLQSLTSFNDSAKTLINAAISQLATENHFVARYIKYCEYKHPPLPAVMANQIQYTPEKQVGKLIKSIPYLVDHYLKTGDFFPLEKLKLLLLEGNSSAGLAGRMEDNAAWSLNFLKLVLKYEDFLKVNDINLTTEDKDLNDIYYRKLDTLQKEVQQIEDSFKVIRPSKKERKKWVQIEFDNDQAAVSNIMYRINSLFEDSKLSDYVICLRKGDSIAQYNIYCDTAIRYFECALKSKPNDKYAKRRIEELKKACAKKDQDPPSTKKQDPHTDSGGTSDKGPGGGAPPENPVTSAKVEAPTRVDDDASAECIRLINDSINRIVNQQLGKYKDLIKVPCTFVNVDMLKKKDPEHNFLINISYGKAFENFLVNYSYRSYELSSYKMNMLDDYLHVYYLVIKYIVDNFSQDGKMKMLVTGHADATPYNAPFKYDKRDFSFPIEDESFFDKDSGEHKFKDLIRGGSDEKNMAMALVRALKVRDYYMSTTHMRKSDIAVLPIFHPEAYAYRNGYYRGVDIDASMNVDMDKIRKICQ